MTMVWLLRRHKVLICGDMPGEVILNLKRQRLTHRNPKTTTTAAVTTTTEASLPQMQNQDIKNDDSDPRSRLKLDKNDRLYPYMGSLNLCIPAGKEYASDCHHLDGTTDVDLEGCKDFMYGQGGILVENNS
eukprot:UN04019